MALKKYYVPYYYFFKLQQKQLGDMEGEVKVIQMELAAIRKDRLDLHNRQHSDIVSKPFLLVPIFVAAFLRL